MSDLKTINQIRDAILQQTADFKSHQDDDKRSFSGMESAQQSIKDSVEHIKHLLDDMKGSIDSLAAESKPVNEWFRNINFARSSLVAIVLFIGSIVGIVLGIKSIISK